jgi:hypothetical protein
VRCLEASSLLAFRHSMMESISGFGAGRAMCPSAAMSWSKLGSTPGPHTSSTRASGWPRSVMHWLIFCSAWPMKELNRWCSAYSPTVLSSCACWCRDCERAWLWPLRDDRPLGARSGLRLEVLPSPPAGTGVAAPGYPFSGLPVAPFVAKASAMDSCDMTAPLRVAPAAAMAWGLSGLVAGELTKLVLRECWMPCTMDVVRLWAYEPDGLRSSVPGVRSGLEWLLGMTTAGVCERGDLLRDDEVRARPRVWLGSRETAGWSIWCDAFPVGRAWSSGRGAAADTAAVSTGTGSRRHGPRRPHRVPRRGA